MGQKLEDDLWAAFLVAKQEERELLSYLILMAVLECRLATGKGEGSAYELSALPGWSVAAAPAALITSPTATAPSLGT